MTVEAQLRPDAQVSSQLPVLCIDVDGTLLRTDLLFESFLLLIKQKPWLLPAIPVWLMRGRAHLKQQLAESISITSVGFQMHHELFQFLKTESKNGRRLILCSASDGSLVNKVAMQLGFPVEVMASDGVVNLKGKKKAQALVERFGFQGFDYVGNSKADLPVWRQARKAIVVNASPQVEKNAREQGNVTLVFPRTGSAVSAIFRAIRVHQWVKNILVFVPLLVSHNILRTDLIVEAMGAFVSMCLLASAGYVMNDLADIESDRRHPSKNRRPFASGELSIPLGMVMVPLLLGAGVAVSLLLPTVAMVILLLYAVLSTAYTFWLKQKLLADVITLAVLYTLRIIEGGAATSLLVSPWLLAFSLFVFMSLAFAKRVTEMVQLSGVQQQGAAGRGYFVPDTTILASLGAVSGYLACLVLSLYINSDSVRQLYSHPGWLWLLMPLLLYWIGRIWILTMRGEISDDPIIFLFRDLHSYATVLLGGMIFLLAKSGPFGIPGVLE